MRLNPERDRQRGVTHVVAECNISCTGAILHFKLNPLVSGFELVTTFEMLKGQLMCHNNVGQAIKCECGA